MFKPPESIVAAICVLAWCACGDGTQPQAVREVPPKPASSAAPNVMVLAPMPITGLARQRTVRLYQPRGYQQSGKRYPVISCLAACTMKRCGAASCARRCCGCSSATSLPSKRIELTLTAYCR